MSAKETMLEEVKDVVIKLGFKKENEEPVFRRISPSDCFQLQNDLKGTSAVDELIKYAILMYEGKREEDTEELKLDDYTVDLMYIDSDGDNVLLYTNNDFLSALQEFKAVGKVRILAKVKALFAATRKATDTMEAIKDGHFPHLRKCKRTRTLKGQATNMAQQGYCAVCKKKSTHCCSICERRDKEVFICFTKDGKKCFQKHLFQLHGVEFMDG